ncbi:MAG TPA: ATP-binding protein [Atribacteraceae bacterium]|nr:ATP-binding protein [Atribacteraceae bacterium]
MKELALHILDIAENSVRAQARTIRITVREDSALDLLEIIIQDDGAGMDEETLHAARDPFFTGQNKKKKIGMGIPLLEQLAEQCGGKLDIVSRKNGGTSLRASFLRSHIDLPPYGNIADTLVVLFGSHPEINFVYEHEKDGCVWSFSSRELLREIGLRHPGEIPRVLPAIRDWIQFHESNLWGGVSNIHEDSKP